MFDSQTKSVLKNTNTNINSDIMKVKDPQIKNKFEKNVQSPREKLPGSLKLKTKVLEISK